MSSSCSAKTRGGAASWRPARATTGSRWPSARRHGAQVVLHGDDYDAAYARAREIEAERGLVFIHPFDDPRVVAGQGTIGLELVEQVLDLETVVVPVGGGGLIGGVALALEHLKPEVRVIGVQSEEMPGMKAALAAGARVTVPAAATIADGIGVRRVGEHTLSLAQQYVDEVVTVSEEEIANAILLLLEIEKTVAEGAGAAPLAALVNRPLGLAGARVALVLSGGNIDVTMLSRIIERGLVKDGRLVRLGALLRDRPGELARVTALIAEARANVVHIEHDRAFARWAAIGETEVELTLEMSGRVQIAELLTRLRAGGYRVEERENQSGR